LNLIVTPPGGKREKGVALTSPPGRGKGRLRGRKEGIEKRLFFPAMAQKERGGKGGCYVHAPQAEKEEGRY